MEIYLKDSSQPYQFWLRVYSKNRDQSTGYTQILLSQAYGV